MKIHISRCARHRRWIGLPILLAATLAFPGLVRAALGDDVAAIAKDRETLHATLRIVPRPDHQIHEMVTPTGSTIREYVSPQTGKVFAVSWSGGWRPDFADLMGSYYDRFVENQKGKRRARGPVRIELPGMVVFTGGYLRTFFGHVYLTDQLPPGFDPSTIQ